MKQKCVLARTFLRSHKGAQERARVQGVAQGLAMQDLLRVLYHILWTFQPIWLFFASSDAHKKTKEITTANHMNVTLFVWSTVCEHTTELLSVFEQSATDIIQRGDPTGWISDWLFQQKMLLYGQKAVEQHALFSTNLQWNRWFEAVTVKTLAFPCYFATFSVIYSCQRMFSSSTASRSPFPAGEGI